MSGTRNGGPLNFLVKIDIAAAKRDAEQMKKALEDLKVAGANVGNGVGFETKPLTEYQAGLLKIKQEALELAKQKAEQARADREASLATQAALREEARLRREALAASKTTPSGKVVTDFGNSQAEADTYAQSTKGSILYTSTINAETVARARLNTEAAIQAVNEGTLRTEQIAGVTATRQSTEATKANNLTKEQSAKLLLEEKYLQAQRTKELKNSIREDLNAKGSLEQRRAALIRLNSAYDKLSVAERESPAGQRLKGIVGSLTDQVKGLEAETGRAQRNVGNYGSAFEKAAGKQGAFSKGLSSVWGGLRKVAQILPGIGIAGLLAFAIDPLMEYIQSLDLFGDKLKDIKNTAAGSSEYKDALSGVTQLKTALDEYHNGQITGKKLVDTYNESIGKTAGNLKTVSDVEAFYNSKAGAFVEAMSLRAQANAALQVSTDKLAEAQKRAVEGPTFEDYAKATGKAVLNTVFGAQKFGGMDVIGQSFANVSNVAIDIQRAASAKAKKEGQEALKMFDDLKKASDKFNKANGLTLDGKGDTSKAGAQAKAKTDASIREATALGEHLTKLLAESSAASMTADQKEVESVKAKYKAMTDEATKFYNDPKNAGRKVVVNGQNFSKGQVFGSINAAQQSELDAIDKKKADAAAKIEQDKYDALVKQFMSYSDKRKQMEVDFNADMAILAKNPGAQAERKAAYEKEVQDEADAIAKSLPEFKALFDGVDQLSDANAKKVVSNAEVMLNSLLASGKISKQLADEIRKLLGNTTNEIGNRMPERIINLANQIDKVAEAVSAVDEGFGKMLHSVANVVGQVGNIKKGLGDLKLAQGKGDMLGSLTAGLGIFGAGMSIVSGIAKLFDRSAEREAQQAYATENQTKQNEALNKALERQVQLINDAYGTDKLAKYAEAQATIIKNEQTYKDQLSKRYSLTGNKVVDDIIKKANETGDAGLLKAFKGNPFEKYKLPVDDLEKLRDLMESGKLDESTKAIVQNLIDAKQAAIDLANQLSAETIGSSLGEVADNFIKNLTDGTQDFGKTFEDVIRTSILNGFKGKLIQQQLQGFYDDFAKATQDGSLSQDEIEKLRTAYMAASEKAKKDFADLEKATGINLTDPASASSAVSGGVSSKGIQAITQETGNSIDGTLRAGYDLTKQNLALNTSRNLMLVDMGKGIGELSDIARNNFEMTMRIEANTFRTANNTERLATIENTLSKIATNTSPSQSSASLTGSR